MSELQKCAEILVECGSGIKIEYIKCSDEYWVLDTEEKYWNLVNPFADTLIGRRQADAIEDWLVDSPNYLLYLKDSVNTVNSNKNHHQWRLDRIKWCIQELIK